MVLWEGPCVAGLGPGLRRDDGSEAMRRVQPGMTNESESKVGSSFRAALVARVSGAHAGARYSSRVRFTLTRANGSGKCFAWRKKRHA